MNPENARDAERAACFLFLIAFCAPGVCIPAFARLVCAWYPGAVTLRSMPENSFDVVSKVDLQEVQNAMNNALKEIHQRFDLKDSKSDVVLEGKDAMVLTSADEYKLKAVNDVLQTKLVRRGVPLKNLQYEAIEPAAGATVRQRVKLQQGIDTEKAREIVKLVKQSKKKVQASIQGDFVRISGKDRDALQEVIALLRQQDFGIEIQFTNYRTV